MNPSTVALACLTASVCGGCGSAQESSPPAKEAPFGRAKGSLFLPFEFHEDEPVPDEVRRDLAALNDRITEFLGEQSERDLQWVIWQGRGFAVVGYMPTEGDEHAGVPDAQKIVTGADLSRLCARERIDEIVVAMDDRRRRFPMDQLLECRLEGVEVVDLVTFLERETGKVRLDILNPSWIIFSEGFRQGRIHSSMERAFDIVASLILAA